MHIVEHTDAALFFAQAHPLLAAREVEHNLLLGVVKAIMAGRYPDVVPRLWAVHDGDALVGVSVHTPPYPILVSAMPVAALDAVAEAILARAILPCRIMGLDAVVDRVREQLVRATGLSCSRVAHMRLFELRRVIPPAATTGRMRRAQPADRQTLAEYLRAFGAEAVPHEPPPPDAEKSASAAIAAGSVFVWEDDAGKVVCMAARAREVGGGASIGPVYTPPEARGRGYASALVAGLSQALLDEGRSYACLFTDLANPVSNRIYARLGYQAIADFSHWDIAP